MTTNFDYKTCTLEELADYIELSPAQRITSALIYYQKNPNEALVEKIRDARKIVKRRKLLRQLEQM